MNFKVTVEQRAFRKKPKVRSYLITITTDELPKDLKREVGRAAEQCFKDLVRDA